MSKTVTVIGAGLAGCEAAWQIAKRGIPVRLIEMKPLKFSPAHKIEGFAELICSNSFKAARVDSAAGLLKEEMRRLGSLLLSAAAECSVPAGGALAVNRESFSAAVTAAIKAHPNITVISEVAEEIPRDGITIVATGPLTEGKLAENIKQLCGRDYLSFYDAAAPIVTAESLLEEQLFLASRYGKGNGDDYINCPMNQEEYLHFYKELISAEAAPLHEFDAAPAVYEGCMPVEIMAKRGQDTLRFGPLKPVGLRDPKTGHRPWAVVQLRKENAQGSLYNLVGFQTNLKFGEQKRVFGLIPALANAEFVRYGVMHRNTFLDAPRLLGSDYALLEHPDIYFAGQITGVEGYMESAASGLLAGINAANKLSGLSPFVLPPVTMLGALTAHVIDTSVKDYQPMGANFGIMPPLELTIRDKRARYAAFSERALEAVEQSNNLTL
ncbi:MAG: methylenetetrahydrofolate--tRNA-(uracil(54)-C(5))-methyltransferase (FADH(2)-oxidizing) TrmFO [Oscillospiraceae bacterium]|nr:methylenetetrahydrofolate--tRNA-(uracil(54)-C(5))-methyltransferase (FADH(2)-oxidizing) TrmFO [Oscillospiraceae bacterium]